MNILGTQIRRKRKELKLTVEALARRAGVSPSALSAIERGESQPTLETITGVAIVLFGIKDMYKGFLETLSFPLKPPPDENLADKIEKAKTKGEEMLKARFCDVEIEAFKSGRWAIQLCPFQTEDTEGTDITTNCGEWCPACQVEERDERYLPFKSGKVIAMKCFPQPVVYELVEENWCENCGYREDGPTMDQTDHKNTESLGGEAMKNWTEKRRTEELSEKVRELETDNKELEAELTSLRLRAMPDYGKPGVVPEFNGYYGFKDRPRGLTQYVSLGNSAMIIDGRAMGIDKILVAYPTCCFTKRPIPEPREKE